MTVGDLTLMLSQREKRNRPARLRASPAKLNSDVPAQIMRSAQ